MHINHRLYCNITIGVYIYILYTCINTHILIYDLDYLIATYTTCVSRDHGPMATGCIGYP